MKNDKYILVTFPESQYYEDYEDYDISDGVYHCVATDFENDKCVPCCFVLEELYNKIKSVVKTFQRTLIQKKL